jgi:uncharacterized protein (TIGR02246 family)
MGMFKKAVLLATGLIAVAACASKAPDTAADEAALKADPLAWAEAYNAGNADGVANLYAEDGILMAPGAPAAAGRGAIQEFIKSDIEKSKAEGLTFKIGDMTGVGVSGDLGWVSGTFSITDASGAAVDAGKFVSVYRRTNGKWQLVRDTWNSDKAPAAAAAPAATGAAAVNMGTWKLNEAKSKLGPSPANVGGVTKNNTVVYEAAGDNVKITVDGIHGDGKAAHNEWTGKFDGKDYPVTGDPNSDARAYTEVDDHTLEMTVKKGGKVTVTGRIAVSADGKSRTVTTSGIDSKGTKVTSIAVYDKQ